ncbi:MFS transporter [Amphibacillus sediminis]|uniref:MFS transporter n=1 Tax=Amphibacillus sediminis TaxID=360185 RepID=UPI0008348903|nr:MFS transporter [Amphibacillus sediminis]
MSKALGRNYMLLFSSSSLSTIGQTFGTFLISWLVYDLTGSELAMGGLWFISIMTKLIVQLLLSPYIDRFQRRIVMAISELVRFIAYGSLLVVITMGRLEVSYLYLASFFASVVVFEPAANALLPAIITKEQLVKANARLTGTAQFIRMVTLPIAGIIVETISAPAALLMVNMIWLFSILLVLAIKERPIDQVQKSNSWLKQFKAGLIIYQQKKILIFLSFFVALVSFGVIATQSMYIPYVRRVLGSDASGYGLFAAAFPFGYVIGSFVLGKLKEPRPSIIYRLMLTVLFCGGLTHIGLGLTTKLVWALVIEMSAGLIMPVWNIYSNLLYQRLVPSRIRGQVFIVRFLMTHIANPFGVMFATYWVTRYSVSSMFVMVGLITCLGTFTGLLYLIFNRSQRAETSNQKLSGMS